MKFTYQAKTKGGEVRSGEVEASSKEAALGLLQRHNLFVTSLQKVGEEPFYKKPIRLFERITSQDLTAFSRQLSVMLESGVPLVEALRTLSFQIRKTVFKEVIEDIVEQVEGGSTLSSAFSEYPKVFSPFYIAMLKSGEATGRLSEVIEYMADHLERRQQFRSKIKGALAYPAFVFVVFIIIGLLMIFVLLPRLADILQQRGQKLPAITEFVLSLGPFLKQWGIWLLLGLAGLTVGVIKYYRSSEGKKVFDRILLNIPLVGDFFKKIYLSYFSENLSTLITGGLSITRALEVTADIVGNSVYHRQILEIKERVKRGEPMSAVLRRHPETFSPLFAQMTVVGEKSGRVDQVLKNTALFYRKEVDRTLETLVSLLEPLMIVVLGAIVGGLVVSVLIPVYRVSGGMM